MGICNYLKIFNYEKNEIKSHDTGIILIKHIKKTECGI